MHQRTMIDQDHPPLLWENPKPYMFSTLDYKAFSPEARLLHFLGSFQEAQTTVNTGSLKQRQRPEMLSRCCVILSVTGNGIGDYVLTSPVSTPYFNSAARASHFELVGWLVVLGLRPFETVFQSISGRLPKRGRKRRERIEESKNVQTTPTRTYCKRNRPLPYYHPNCRTPRHWKFTQDHRTTRPPHPI